MGQMRPLKLETLWVVPVVYLAGCGADVLVRFRRPAGSQSPALALLIGAAVGWQRGKMMQIHVDPETHALNQKASPAAMFFLIALIVVRSGARTLLGQTSGGEPGDADRSADRLRARHVHSHPSGDVSSRQAPARRGPGAHLMGDDRRFYEAAASGARRSAPAALRNREPIAEAPRGMAPGGRTGPGDRERQR